MGCYLCDGDDHFVKDCEFLGVARKMLNLIRDRRRQKDKAKDDEIDDDDVARIVQGIALI